MMSNALRLSPAEYEAIRERQLSARARSPVDAKRPRARAGLSDAKPSKFRSVKTGGYASKRESDRAFVLKLMLEAGQIRNLREQVEYELIPKQAGELACKYRADFVYEEFGSDAWREVVEDCKGFRTEVYRLKRKLMLHVHGVKVRET